MRNFYEAEEDLDIYDDVECEVDLDNKYEDAYLEGYLDAINEMKMNPLGIIGGGDIKGDLRAIYGIGDAPHRIDAVKYYMSKGNTIKGGIIGRTYGMTPEGTSYIKNRFLKGATTDDTGDEFFEDIYLRLKPADRKKIMQDYMNHYKVKKFR